MRRSRKPLNLHGFREFESHPHRQEIRNVRLSVIRRASIRSSGIEMGRRDFFSFGSLNLRPAFVCSIDLWIWINPFRNLYRTKVAPESRRPSYRLSQQSGPLRGIEVITSKLDFFD